MSFIKEDCPSLEVISVVVIRGRDPMGNVLFHCNLCIALIFQTPVFVNRELVELGFASWKEDSLQTSSLVVHKSTADS